MEKKRGRSDKYQFVILEKFFSNDMMESFANSSSISNILNPFEYSEDLLDLEDDLKKEFWRLVDDNLTNRQKEVMHLYAEGWTQTEISNKLGINQSSITKSLHGNVDYKNNKISYGGTIKKLKKLIETDPMITDILDKMNQIREQKW